MCRARIKTGQCSELGPDPTRWSTRTTLPKPAEFDSYLDRFVAACHAAATGDVDTAAEFFRRIHDDELREWYVEHAQNAGGFRFRGLGERSLNHVADELDPNKNLASFSASLYERDAFHCRYCESRVLPKAVFQRLAQRVPTFTLGRTNAARPGIYLVYCATLDHVVPHQAGGRTDADNLVTSCWPCNYGKYKYSLAQLGMDSPFDYPPVDDAVWAETVRLLAR
jgi:hypothetical protein